VYPTTGFPGPGSAFPGPPRNQPVAGVPSGSGHSADMRYLGDPAFTVTDATLIVAERFRIVGVV
jgi:hypothetical protein